MRVFILLLIICTGIDSISQGRKVFVFLNSKPAKEKLSEVETADLMKLHLANIEKLVSEGKLIVAGPFDGGGGIFIFNTDKVSQTKEWLATDPAVRANRWDIEMFPVEFTKGGGCLAKEPYEMVTYNFIRVQLINPIANYKMNATEIAGWAKVNNQDSVIAVGRFPQKDGGIIVYKGDSNPKWRENFSTDQVSLNQKRLWVARGSFCEQ